MNIHLFSITLLRAKPIRNACIDIPNCEQAAAIRTSRNFELYKTLCENQYFGYVYRFIYLFLIFFLQLSRFSCINCSTVYISDCNSIAVPSTANVMLKNTYKHLILCGILIIGLMQFYRCQSEDFVFSPNFVWAPGADKIYNCCEYHFGYFQFSSIVHHNEW